MDLLNFKNFFKRISENKTLSLYFFKLTVKIKLKDPDGKKELHSIKRRSNCFQLTRGEYKIFH